MPLTRVECEQRAQRQADLSMLIINFSRALTTDVNEWLGALLTAYHAVALSHPSCNDAAATAARNVADKLDAAATQNAENLLASYRSKTHH